MMDMVELSGKIKGFLAAFAAMFVIIMFLSVEVWFHSEPGMDLKKKCDLVRETKHLGIYLCNNKSISYIRSTDHPEEGIRLEASDILYIR